MGRNIYRRFTTDSDRVLKFLPTLNEQEIIDIPTKALGEVLSAHMPFVTNESPVGKTSSSAAARDRNSAAAHHPTTSLQSRETGPSTTHAAESAIEMPSHHSPAPVAPDARPSLRRLNASRTHVAALQSAGFSSTSSGNSRVRSPGDEQFGCLELQEVVIGGQVGDGVAPARLHGGRSIAHGASRDLVPKDAESRVAAASGISTAAPISLAALPPDVGGKSGIRSLLSSIRLSMEARADQGMESDCSSGSGSCAPSASLPHLGSIAHVSTSIPQHAAGGAVASIPLPPPPSRSRLKHTAVHMADSQARGFQSPASDLATHHPPPRNHASNNDKLQALRHDTALSRVQVPRSPAAAQLVRASDVKQHKGEGAAAAVSSSSSKKVSAKKLDSSDGAARVSAAQRLGSKGVEMEEC